MGIASRPLAGPRDPLRSARFRSGAGRERIGALSLPRPAHLAVGLAGYLLALGSMVYFAGFLAGLVVPKTVDSGVPGPAAQAVAVDLALLVAFALTHSLLAREGVKLRLARVVPVPLERSIYSGLAGLQIALICALWRPLPAPVWQTSALGDLGGTPAAYLLWALYFGGWGVVLAALWTIGSAHLFGLAEAWASARGKSYTPRPLAAKGIYRRIRHPLYSGTLLTLWAAPTLSRGHLLLAAVLTLYLAVGYRFEERDLERRHGAPYLDYRARVPAFVPRLWPSARRQQAASTGGESRGESGAEPEAFSAAWREPPAAGR
jgi:protein-S-isoprenylcysteine O-methyltransferase Ste14